jgi:uncharacterized membrane protein
MSQIPPPIPNRPLGYATPSLPDLNLRKVAFQQRAIMLCILGAIFALVAGIFSIENHMPALGGAFYLIYLGVVVTGAVFIFMLSITLYNTAAGIILGILTLLPLIGLIVLLIVNSKATKTLRARGIKVGLLGANPASIPAGSIG